MKGAKTVLPQEDLLSEITPRALERRRHHSLHGTESCPCCLNPFPPPPEPSGQDCSQNSSRKGLGNTKRNNYFVGNFWGKQWWAGNRGSSCMVGFHPPSWGSTGFATTHSPPFLPDPLAAGSPADALTPCAWHKTREHGVTKQNMRFNY